MPKAELATNRLDRVLLALAPQWGLKRVRSRAIAQLILRHYEAAQPGRRTVNWNRSFADANSAIGPALTPLRAHARDLVRNNGWARNALRTIANNTVGWGIVPKAVGLASATQAQKVNDAWKAWANTTECDADGRQTFYGLQKLAMRCIAEAGEVLVRRRRRYPEDGQTVPLQLQVLEPDFLDTTKHGVLGEQGGPIIEGVEFDLLGRRVAYWLWTRHPGANYLTVGQFGSKRVPASEIAHIYDPERAGQARGITWFAPTIVKLKDFDEYEDATLMRQKIAACFAAFVTDVDGTGTPLGGKDATQTPPIESIEPGMINYLAPGKTVTFGNPPVANDGGFSERTLRWIAASMGVTFEDLTGDYSQVNFSSARMGRIKHQANVNDWRWNMLIPQFCDPLWGWFMEAAQVAGLVDEMPKAQWTPPPMAMIEPDKEGLALQRMVRGGSMTFSEMIRQQGDDPEEHFEEYAEDLKRLDALGITLDSDPRKVNQAGQVQSTGGAPGEEPEEPEEPEDGAEKAKGKVAAKTPGAKPPAPKKK